MLYLFKLLCCVEYPHNKYHTCSMADENHCPLVMVDEIKKSNKLILLFLYLECCYSYNLCNNTFNSQNNKLQYVYVWDSQSENHHQGSPPYNQIHFALRIVTFHQNTQRIEVLINGLSSYMFFFT